MPIFSGYSSSGLSRINYNFFAKTAESPGATVNYVLVAGGGGGSGGYNNTENGTTYYTVGGGGGAGGLRTGIIDLPYASAITVTIGAGGVGTANYTPTSGSNSTFHTFIAHGGGAAGGGAYSGVAGGSGGGVGRSRYPTHLGGAGNIGNFDPPEGNKGGDQNPDYVYTSSGGTGGGGYSEPGSTNTPQNGNGGNGLITDVAFSPLSVDNVSATIAVGAQTLTTAGQLPLNIAFIMYADSDNYMWGHVTAVSGTTGDATVRIVGVVGSGTYSAWTFRQAFAGGGGGGNWGSTAGSEGTGGIGGGGKGGKSTARNGDDAGVNSGGGGGGGAYPYLNESVGGDGGSGILVISFPTSMPGITSVSAGLVCNNIAGGINPDVASRPGYKVYKFTSGTGNFKIVPAIPPSQILLLVVGGGGSGGASRSGATAGGTGGGGGGGFYYNETYNVTSGTAISISVGVGGSGTARTSGGNSSFGDIVCIGGGRGESLNGNYGALSGGSGGGAAGSYNAINRYGGQGTDGQGHKGGDSLYYSASHLYTPGGAGGGGANSNPINGNGGDSGTNSPNGGSGGSGGIAVFGSYAGGGGGGGGYTASPVAVGTGGSAAVSAGAGKGGNASTTTTGGSGSNGTANRGGGGGGAGGGALAGALGGNGGSGVVIVSYPDYYANLSWCTLGVVSNSVAGSIVPDITSKPGYKTYIFTAGIGTISW